MEKKESMVLKNMTDHSEEVFFIFDVKENRFIYVNNAFEDVTKKSRAELFDDPMSLYTLVHKEDSKYVKQSFNNLSDKTTSSLLEFRIILPDHNERWIRIKVYPLIEEHTIQYLSGIMEDDSARQVGLFNMQKINAWKDSTLDILSHDLRGPIGIVKMIASGVKNKLRGAEDEKIYNLLKMIEEISNRNIDLIESLLKRESLDTVSIEIVKQRIDLVWEVSEVMNIYKDSQRNIKKQFEYTYSHEEIFAEIDSMKFLQIINNLISNAMKFTREDGNIKVHLEKLEKTVLITVSDNGIGIPRSLQPILFTKYTKAGRKGLNGEESIGLGMWIIKSLTEAHFGKIWFESEEDKGTKFYLEIPKGAVEK